MILLLKKRGSNLNIRDCFFVLSLFFVIVSFSCGNNSTGSDEKPLAKVGDAYLYPSELNEISSGSSKEDSIQITSKYINNWIREMLLLQKAEKNLSDDKKNLIKWWRITANRSSLTNMRANW